MQAPSKYVNRTPHLIFLKIPIDIYPYIKVKLSAITRTNTCSLLEINTEVLQTITFSSLFI